MGCKIFGRAASESECDDLIPRYYSSLTAALLSCGARPSITLPALPYPVWPVVPSMQTGVELGLRQTVGLRSCDDDGGSPGQGVRWTGWAWPDDLPVDLSAEHALRQPDNLV